MPPYQPSYSDSTPYEPVYPTDNGGANSLASLILPVLAIVAIWKYGLQLFNEKNLPLAIIILAILIFAGLQLLSVISGFLSP